MRFLSLLALAAALLAASAAHARVVLAPTTLHDRIVYLAGTTYAVVPTPDGGVTLGAAKSYRATAVTLRPDGAYTELYRLEWDLLLGAGGWAAAIDGRWEYRQTSELTARLRLLPTGGEAIEYNLTFSTERNGMVAPSATTGQEVKFWLGEVARPYVPLATAAPLVNVSLRATVNPAGLAIAGFVVSGSSPRALLVRAVGPGLTPFGIASPLADPQAAVPGLALPLTRNDDWAAAGPATLATLRRMETLVGAFPLPAGSKDAVLLLPEVPPGAHTVVVDTAQRDAGGEVLIEVYVLP